MVEQLQGSGSTSKKRIEYIDAMRGFTMLLVVFGHVLTHGLNNYSESSVVYSFFQTFRMPMFFFISGYIAYKATEYWDFDFYKKNLRKKAIIQLVPTVFFFILYGVVFRINFVSAFLKEGVGLYWFCQTLFEMFLIYYTIQLICKYTSEKLFTWLILLAMVVTKVVGLVYRTHGILYDTLLLYRLLPYFMYFALGLLCKKYNDVFLRLMKNDAVKALLILLFFFLFIFKYHHNIPYGKNLLYLSDHLVIRVAGLFCVFSFFLCHSDFFARNGKVSQTMQFVGRRTLDIYLLHYFFIPDLSCCNEFLSTDTRAVLELLFGFGLASIIIAVSLLCSAFIRNSEFLGHYLFGVKSDKYSY